MRERPRTEEPPGAGVHERRRGLRVLAWAVWAATMAAYAVAVTLLEAQWTLRYLPGFLILFTVGLAIALRRPRNPIGWILQGSAAAISLLVFADGYLHASLERGSVLPGTALAFLLLTTFFYLGVVPQGTFILLLFPTGRLPSARWRPVAWAAGTGLALTTLSGLLLPGPIGGEPVDNPLGVEAAGGVLSVLGEVGTLLLPMCVLASIGSLFFRWRRADGAERQQIKWLLYACGLLVPFFLLTFGIGPLIPEDPDSLLWQVTDTAGIVVPVTVLPGAVAVAILRHRLYDIDLLINRTIIYALLTATLAATYAAVVLPLGVVFAGESSLVVAGATLAVAAAFQPARRRIQDLVDRRFNRRRYDAERTIAAFSGRLRQQTDLDALTTELLSVVDQTMQPTRAALWLRPAADVGSGGARVGG